VTTFLPTTHLTPTLLTFGFGLATPFVA
jgi:hypothetical protein